MRKKLNKKEYQEIKDETKCRLCGTLTPKDIMWDISGLWCHVTPSISDFLQEHGWRLFPNTTWLRFPEKEEYLICEKCYNTLKFELMTGDNISHLLQQF
jgi:hypothetical protein